jgi:lauroyl/myristoyl acyltransferase
MPFSGEAAVLGIEPGRGIIFSTPHYGPQMGFPRLPRLVGQVDVAIGDHLYADEALPGYNGYQNEQARKVLSRNGYRMVRAIGSSRTFASTLSSGGRVLMNFDVPGKTPVRFLGKTVELASGTARLAEQTDSVVVPALPRPGPRGWYAHLDAPLDPRRHDGWEHLLQATADVLSRLILAAPEYLENPMRESGWAVASPDGWRRTA